MWLRFFFLLASIWWVGGKMTLEWLGSISSMRGILDTIGPLAWLVPLAITTLEMGMLVARSRIVWAWVFWSGVIVFDIYTTAAGLLLFVAGREVFGYLITVNDVTSWVIACAVGLFIAIVPEPAMRSIWRDLWQS